MKRTDIQPYSQQLTVFDSTDLMLVQGSHSVESFKDAGTMNIGGDDGDVDGYETPNSLSPSAAKERMLWGEGESGSNTSSGGLW